MQGFSDIREINFEYLSKRAQDMRPRVSALGLGAPLGGLCDGLWNDGLHRTDTLRGPELELPVVIYDKSYSVLETSFDECIDVKGILVPKRLKMPHRKAGRRNLCSRCGNASIRDGHPMLRRAKRLKRSGDRKGSHRV